MKQMKVKNKKGAVTIMEEKLMREYAAKLDRKDRLAKDRQEF